MEMFPNQNILFSSTDVSLQNDLVAATAYTASLRDYVYPTSYEGDEIIYHSHQYLDSELLHYWLSKVQKSFSPNNYHQQIVPIFLFDFSYTEMMLIDRKHAVVSFPDMVIAVQTEEESVRIPYVCQDNPISIDGRDATREIMGALLQTLWGVLPTGDYWSKSHKQIENDWMWNVGRTPFGPFSDSKELSFVQIDSIKRPQLYQLINQTITHTLEPLLDVHVSIY